MLHDLAPIAARSRHLMDDLGDRLLGSPLAELGWGFDFDSARRRLGRCSWTTEPDPRKLISLSGPIASREGWIVMEDVVRHEIAHALDFETRGRSAHDAVWRAWARKCGADPARTYKGELGEDDTAPYAGCCPAPGCGYTRPFYRTIIRAYACPRCSKSGVRTFLRIEERRTGRVLRAGGATPGELSLAGGPKFVGRCPHCGKTRPFGRRPVRRYACGACCRLYAEGRFDERFELEIYHRR